MFILSYMINKSSINLNIAHTQKTKLLSCILLYLYIQYVNIRLMKNLSNLRLCCLNHSYYIQTNFKLDGVGNYDSFQYTIVSISKAHT